MRFICALVTVSDMQRSRDFYERVLNQKIKYDFGENITFHGDFAIHLQSHFSKLIDNKEVKSGNNNFESYFEYDNLEKVVAVLKANGVTFVHDIREQPWRQKVVRFYDPDENIIEVGESLEYLSYRLWNEGVSIDLISQTTNMPVDFVNSSIEKFKKN